MLILCTEKSRISCSFLHPEGTTRGFRLISPISTPSQPRKVPEKSAFALT